MTDFELDILPIAELKAHEETLPDRVLRIKKEILEMGIVSMPLWADEKSRIVLNGHHRLAALKMLGCARVPVLLIDYENPCVTVNICPGSAIPSISKSMVITAALSGQLFAPRSSLHRLNFTPPNFPVSLAILQQQKLTPIKI